MSEMTRRRLLISAGTGAAGLALGGVLLSRPGAVAQAPPPTIPATLRLAASDGFIRLPGRADDLLMFGFRPIPVGATINEAVALAKGKTTVPSPILAINQGAATRLDLTNVGFITRPDLDDAHTIHWHGFRNATAIFDGTPEMSIAVPPNRTFPYYYKPLDPGTYMYHCHFEDVEHVQMGMTGVVYVRPTMGPRFAYNDASTAFDREFTLLLNEIDPRPHDGLLAVQEFQWVDYRPRFWIINGRAWPDTIKAPEDPSLAVYPDNPAGERNAQRISSLIQCNPTDKVLLRIVDLGYDQHAMTLTGISMKVIGEDATLLRGPGGADLSYDTNTIYIGPGESRDVLFTAPGFDAAAAIPSPTGSSLGSYNRYLFKNRNLQRLNNDGQVDSEGLGGMVTEVRVYEDSLPAQTSANQYFA